MDKKKFGRYILWGLHIITLAPVSVILGGFYLLYQLSCLMRLNILDMRFLLSFQLYLLYWFYMNIELLLIRKKLVKKMVGFTGLYSWHF